MNENRIKIIREELGGITQQNLAESLGFPVHRIKDAEAGKVKISTDLAEVLEEKFGFSFRWSLTGQGPMYKPKQAGGVSLVATGDGIVQAGGKISGKVIQVRQGSEPVWIKDDHPLKDDIEEIFQLLKLYGSPKVIQEIKERLLRIKAAVEGE